ncbi:histone H1-like [Uloborus diversus]|uniref:histone H1-like n=1 Tax=Uloborus diversus TaxID=327109 RepID=UPI0024097AD7|nr:histone H1-like [Uloborus diversus]
MAEKTSASPKIEKETASTKGLGRQIMNAIRKLQGTQGTTLSNIKSFLSNTRNVDTKQKGAEIKMYLKNALDRGQLMSEAGNYKVAEKVQKKIGRGRKGRSMKTSPKKQARKLAKPKATRNTGQRGSRKRKSPKKSG